MRVLAKPELDSSVILNEFVMIMENFGVPDSMEDDEFDDYIPDTEMSVDQSAEDPMKKADKAKDADKKKEDEIFPKEKDNDKKEGIDAEVEDYKKDEKPKKKPRKHNLENIDAKGIKILRKLARFLLKQFLHPREFFGKAITKE